MKRFDDEDLIAHYLHELPPRKASALETALQTDPTLAARYEAYGTMLSAFKAGAATMVFDDEVIARNWKAMRPALAASRVSPVRPFRWRFPALAGAGLALAATALFFATRPHDATSPSPPLQAGSVALSTSPSESASASATPIIEEQYPAQQRGHAGKPSPHLLTFAPPALRMTTPLPLGTTNAAVPHFIPLASASLPVLLPNFVVDRPTGLIEPTDSPQKAAPRAPSKPRHSRTSVHHEYPTDLTFAMGGSLIGTREVSGAGTDVHVLGATHAITALAAFHQQLRPAVGYRVTVSYSRPDFQYALRNATTNSGQQDINGRIYELAATYVVQGPHRGGLTTSTEAGGGLMAILPTLQNTETSSNFRGAAVVGISVDYALSKHLGIHAAYRAQVFKGPDFNYSGPGNSVVGTTFFSNEPMVGITYRFHSK